MSFLIVEGNMVVPRDVSVLKTLAEITAKHGMPASLEQDDNGFKLFVNRDSLHVGEEDNFCDYLLEIGKTLPGKVVGEFEVWWPMAESSGPQWWTLNEVGQFFVTESELIRGEPKLYGGR